MTENLYHNKKDGIVVSIYPVFDGFEINIGNDSQEDINISVIQALAMVELLRMGLDKILGPKKK